MGDLAYGIIGAVLVAPAFAAQVRQPDQRIMPLQQIALVALALAVAAVASGEPIGLVGVPVLLVPLAIVLALHPRRRHILRRPERPSTPLLVLALGAAVPAFAYAWRTSSSGRADLPPEDSFAYVPSLWAAAAAMAVAIVLVALLAALGPPGWHVSAVCVGVGSLLFGVASIVNPDIAASGGRVWGGAALLWSLVWFAAAARARRGRPPDVIRSGDTHP